MIKIFSRETDCERHSAMEVDIRNTFLARKLKMTKVLILLPSLSPRRRCEDNIRMDFKPMGISTRNRIDSP